MSYSLFATLSTSLRSHSYGLDTLASNTANVNTPGAKAQSTEFKTIVHNNNRFVDAHHGPEHGAKHFRRVNISAQGTIEQTRNGLDLAINGDGFFMVLDESRASSERQLTRSGQFATTVIENNGAEDLIITDQEGNPLLGWQADTNNNFAVRNEASLGPISVHPNRITQSFIPTSQVEPTAHLPYRRGDIGDEYTIDLPIVDAQGRNRNVQLLLTQTDDPDRWEGQFQVENGGVSTEPFELRFDPETGYMINPPAFDLEVSWNRTDEQQSGNAAFHVDLEHLNSTGEDFITLQVAADGRTAGNLINYAVNEEGFVIGEFTNGKTGVVAQIPLVDVINRDGLEPIDGTRFALTEDAGDLEVYGLDSSSRASIHDFGLEASTIDLQANFTDLISTQHAYSSLSSVLSAYNEMSQLAVSMKR